MTVKELIALLSQANPDARVVVDGYEGGYADVFEDAVTTIKIALNLHDEWYYGQHEDPDYHLVTPDDEVVEAILIGRNGEA